MLTGNPIQNDYHGRTDIGRKRETNQDRFLIADLKRQMMICESNLPSTNESELVGDLAGKLMIVADGVGGQFGGEIASRLAVQTACHHVLNSMHCFLKLNEKRDQELRDELAVAVEYCQRRLALEGRHRPELASMGTTLTMAYIVWPQMYVVHVGDSRCYLFRDRQLRQLTTDHTVAQLFQDGGALKKRNIDDSLWRHVIWNFLGGNDPNIAPEVTRVDLKADDVVLLCSDGLTDHLTDQQLVDILTTPISAEEQTQRLIDASNAAGGYDNITAIVARFPKPQSPTSTCGVETQQATTT